MAHRETAAHWQPKQFRAQNLQSHLLALTYQITILLLQVTPLLPNPHSPSTSHLLSMLPSQRSLHLVSIAQYYSKAMSFSPSVLVCFCAAVVKTFWPKVIWGRDWWLWLTCYSLSPRKPRHGAQNKNQSQNHRGNLLSSLLLRLVSLTLLIQPRATCLGVVVPTMGWALLHQPKIKKILHRHAHTPIWWGQSHSQGCLFPVSTVYIKLMKIKQHIKFCQCYHGNTPLP